MRHAAYRLSAIEGHVCFGAGVTSYTIFRVRCIVELRRHAYLMGKRFRAESVLFLGSGMFEDEVAVRVEITGRVQGVGYRHWTNLRASRAGLTGFVRNRGDGSVEAVFSGLKHDVDDMVLRCKVGPRGAGVKDVRVEPWNGATFDGFSILPTA